MDELVIKGRKYISSKRASELTGYAKDYVGQMVRLGKLQAVRVGRAWYVLEDQLLSMTSDEDSRASTKPDLTGRYVVSSESPKTWSPVMYYHDDSDLIPNIESRVDEIEPKINVSRLVQSDSVLDESPEIRYKTIPGSLDGVTRREVQPLVPESTHVRTKKVQSKTRRPKFIVFASVTASLLLALASFSAIFISNEVHFTNTGTQQASIIAIGYELIGEIVAEGSQYLP